MKPVRALLSVATVALPAAVAFAAPTYKLEIARHEDVVVDDATIDRILKAASGLLAGGSDFPCDVTFIRGKITTIGRTKLPAVLRSQLDFDELEKLPGDIKVVSQIQYCGAYQPYLGCAAARSGVLAVTPISAADEGVLWAHEFAHCKGATHDYTKRPRRLMSEYIAKDHTEVSQDECKLISYQRATNCGVPRLSGGKAPPTLRPVDTTKLEPLLTVVRRQWAHGVPYEIASRYDLKAGLEVVQLLEQPSQREHWANVVTAVGMIGSPELVEPLVKFFGRGEGVLDDAESTAKYAVPVALGYIVNKSKAPAAQNFLVRNSNPNAVAVSWKPTHLKNVDRQMVGREIALQCAIGLALSGTAGAARRLEDIAQSVDKGAFTLDIGTGTRAASKFIDELKATQSRGAKEGLESQFKSRDALD